MNRWKGNKLILSHDLAKSIDFKFNSVRHNRTLVTTVQLTWLLSLVSSQL